MKLPRDVSGQELIRALRRFGYEWERQRGSHVRLTTMVDGEHHEAIPMHGSIRVGTLATILSSVAEHHGLSVEELREQLRL